MTNKTLWAPWRSSFILGKKEHGCVFCNRLKKRDSIRNLVLFRGEKNFVILNKFPYTVGHTLVLPNRHVGQVEKLREDESIEFFALTQKVVAAMKRALKPDGLNLGMNLGRTAGAGLPGHCHMHIVPRWNGDTNFMPAIGKVRVHSIPMEKVYEALKKELATR
jgi:ATP adenylyltransferase